MVLTITLEYLLISLTKMNNYFNMYVIILENVPNSI